MQADILTLASMGCHPLSVITAITVQDTLGVEGLLAMDSEWVADQARALLEDMTVDAFKIGVMGSVENIAAIAEVIADYPDVPLILDPVLASGRGDELASDEMTHALRELLLPQTTIITPNSLEARRLAESDEDDDEPTLAACAERLDRVGRRVRADHRHARIDVAGGQHALRQGGRACAATPGRGCPAATTAPAARSPRRSPRCSPTASTWPKRCAKRRTTRGMRSTRRFARAWASTFPIACSGRARTTTRRRAEGDAEARSATPDARGGH